MPPIAFSRKFDGVGNGAHANDVNELQVAIEALGALSAVGQLIVGSATGWPPNILGPGTSGQVLTVQSDLTLAWATPGSGGFANPMTTSGDLLRGGTSGAATRLAIGATNQVLTVVSGLPAWANAAAGFSDPETTIGDLIYHNVSNVAARLPIGTTGQVLTVSGGVPAWAAAAMTNPMTTSGDVITGGASGAVQRLGIGATNQVLTVVGGVPAWANAASGFTNPMTTKGDLIAGGTSGAATRLGVGANGQVVMADSAQTLGVKWAPYTLNPPLIYHFRRSSTSGFSITYTTHDTGAYATTPGFAGTIGPMVSGVVYDVVVDASGIELSAPSADFIYLGCGVGSNLSNEVSEGTAGGERTPGNSFNAVITGDGTTTYTAGATIRVGSGTGSVSNGVCRVECRPRS